MKTILAACAATGALCAGFWAGSAAAQATQPGKPPVVAGTLKPAAGQPGNPDTNGDGKLSPAEFAALREAMLLRLDVNHDGAITTAEVDADEDRGIAQEVDDTFKRFDTNGDGSVSKAEMTAVIKGQYKAKRSNGLGPLDADNNGTVTKAEIDQMAKAEFARADTNHDGFITRQELAAAQGGRGAPTSASAAAPRTVKAPAKSTKR